MAVFFGLKFALGLILIGVSSAFLSIPSFVVFSQLFLFYALLSTVSAAGVQNGLVRQIAIANGNVDDERRVSAAAIRIWLAASLIAIIVAVLLRAQVSRILVGDASVAPIVPLVTLGGAGGGFGMLACAILNGRHRAPTSLLLQSAGFIVGGALCIWRLMAGDAVGAVLGYAAGPIATSVLAIVTLHLSTAPVLSIRATHWHDISNLLKYSIAFLMIATIMPSTLFLLRYIYRDLFGENLLGYWLAANRVSDVTSQILGLYMAQIFLPQATREMVSPRLRPLIIRTLLLCSAVMLSGWMVFSVGARFFVSTFLSPAYLPAIPFIGGYLLGDALRVLSSLTSHLMLAAGRLTYSVAIEAGVAALLAVYVIALAALGRPEAPYWAYPAAYASISAILVLTRHFLYAAASKRTMIH